MELKIGDLVQVCKGQHKGLIGRVHEIQENTISIVRIKEDIDKGLLPIMGDWNIKDIYKIYTDKELRYAATSICKCGAGMAYAKDKPFTEVNSWECSDILTGRALIKDPECKSIHTGEMPFIIYDIKSEDQPSAMGKTTRLKKD